MAVELPRPYFWWPDDAAVPGRVYTGADFNARMDGLAFYKAMRPDWRDHGFQYKEGRNDDTAPFDPTGSCRPGGLYAVAEAHAAVAINYMDAVGIVGYQVCRVEVPDDARVWVEACDNGEQKFKASALVLNKRDCVSRDEFVQHRNLIHPMLRRQRHITSQTQTRIGNQVW